MNQQTVFSLLMTIAFPAVWQLVAAPRDAAQMAGLPRTADSAETTVRFLAAEVESGADLA